MRFDWRGLIALVIAAGVVATLIGAEFLAAHNPARATGLTSEEANTVSTVLGALIGAVAVYLGGSSRPGPPPTGSVGSTGDESTEDR